VLVVVVVAVLLGAGLLVADATWARGFWFRPSTTRFQTVGLDVSHHQGAIDWPRVGQSEVKFVYLKATEGRDWSDARFAKNWLGAREAGLVAGAYHFFSFCSPGVAQAEHFLSVLPVDDDMLAPALDVEFGGNCKSPPPASAIQAEVRAWLEHVEAKLGTRPVLYVTEDALDALFDSSQLDGAAGAGPLLWYRSVLFEPSLRPPATWTFWQYHSRGRVEGIDGPVDLNVFAGPADTLPLRRAGARQAISE